MFHVCVRLRALGLWESTTAEPSLGPGHFLIDLGRWGRRQFRRLITWRMLLPLDLMGNRHWSPSLICRELGKPLRQLPRRRIIMLASMREQ